MCILFHVEKREESERRLKLSLNNFDESNQRPIQGTIKPTPRHVTSSEPRKCDRHDGNNNDEAELLVINQRQPRSIDVTSSTIPLEYRRPNEKQYYPITTGKRNQPSETTPFEYYVGYSPERENVLPYVKFVFVPNLMFITRIH